MPEISRSVDIDAPAEVTWAAVVDWEQHGRWMLFTSVERGQQRGEGVGGRTTAFTGFGPLGLNDPMRITVWRPPYRCEVRHEGRRVRGVGAFDVESLPGGRSRFTWSEWVEPPLGALGQLGFAVFRPVFSLFLDVCLRRLARWAPTRS